MVVLSNSFYFRTESWGNGLIWQAYVSSGLKPPSRNGRCTTSCSILGCRYPIDDKSTCKGCQRGTDKGMLDDSFKYVFLVDICSSRLRTTNQYGLVSITREGHKFNHFCGLLPLCLPELSWKKRIHISIRLQCPPTNQKCSNSINDLELKTKALASRTSN